MNCPSSCLKINNPIRNLLLPVIVFALIEKLFGYLFYMTLFQDVWTPYESLFRPMDQVNYWCLGMTIVGAIYALMISFFYVKLCNLSKKQICLFGFAFVAFLLGRFFGEIYQYLMYPYDLKMMFLGMSQGFVTILVWALICKKIFVINVKN